MQDRKLRKRFAAHMARAFPDDTMPPNYTRREWRALCAMRGVIRMRDELGFTLKQIGDVTGTSAERVRQVIAKGRRGHRLWHRLTP